MMVDPSTMKDEATDTLKSSSKALDFVILAFSNIVKNKQEIEQKGNFDQPVEISRMTRAKVETRDSASSEVHLRTETSWLTRFSGKFHSSGPPLGRQAIALSESTMDLTLTYETIYTYLYILQSIGSVEYVQSVKVIVMSILLWVKSQWNLTSIKRTHNSPLFRRTRSPFERATGRSRWEISRRVERNILKVFERGSF
ncbi:hypothetical protein HZH66_004072 [Vespula vulgaris]|uniref:Uncharacterized protein n=2 Tax=Vespula TaxID=7451 RepID=A0A834KJF8_VESVU|nr:hypothetical protein HZH66_004072 [Vespula vulgaris]